MSKDTQATVAADNLLDARIKSQPDLIKAVHPDAENGESVGNSSNATLRAGVLAIASLIAGSSTTS